MKIFISMPTIRLSLIAMALALGGCANFENPFVNANHDMIPLEGAGEHPSIRNRFPESRGGLPLSKADREDRDMTPLERLKQY